MRVLYDPSSLSSRRLYACLLGSVLLAAGMLLSPRPASGQTTIYVDDDVSGDTNGSQSDPYGVLQEAFSEASSTSGAVEVRVAGGVYYPDEGSGVTDGDSSATFSLSGDLTVKGGYTSDFSGRDPAANVTVLSGDIDQDDTTNEDGVVTDTANISGTNSTHVLRAQEISGTATLDGLTITAGQANDSDPDQGFKGGGLLSLSSIVVLDGATVRGNYTTGEFGQGGGVHQATAFAADPGSLAVNNGTLAANAAGEAGGAVSVQAGPLTMTNVTVRNNVANEGGGVHSASSKHPTLSNVTFISNKAVEPGDTEPGSGNGGGLLVNGSFGIDKTLVLQSLTFENNTTEYTGFGEPSGSKGAGAHLDVQSPRIIDVTFRGNTVSKTDAGGLFLSTRSGGVLRNGLFENNAASSPNLADASGGAMVISGFDESITVTNTTFRNNSSATSGGAVVASNLVTFDGVLFENNSTTENGGALDFSGRGWILRDVVFRGNTSDGTGTNVGGGALAASVNPFSGSGLGGKLKNVRFEDNESGEDGGAMRVDGGTYELQNVDFIDNVTGGDFGGEGAALLNDGGTVDLVNAEIRGNDGPSGIVETKGEFDDVGTNRLVNVLLASNGTETAGSGVVLNGSNGITTVDNVVVANNGGTGLVNSNTMTVHNSIVYDSEGVSNIDEINNSGTLDVQNTLVRGGLTGDYVNNNGTINDNGGNISGDPMFADPSNGDYHLQSGSPAVDAGNDSLLPADSLDLDADDDTTEAVPYDLDQRSRAQGTVDMGSYEQGASALQFTASLSSGASEAGLPESFGADLTFQTLSTSTDLTVTYDGSASTEGLGLPGTQGLAVTALWNIEFDPEPSSSNIDATVCFDIGDLSFPVVDRSALNVYARSGSSASDWQERTPTELRPSADNPEQVCATGQSTFSQFAVTAQESELPVELAQFRARTDDDAVVLTWQTASETGNAGFEVQRRPDGAEAWTDVGFVEGAGTTDQARQYRYTVGEDLAPGTHHFRLRQVDTDGTAHLSKAVTVELTMTEPVRLTAPAPNPVQNRATFSFAVKEATTTTLRLYNVLGQQVATLYKSTPAAGESQTVDLSATGLSSGVYFLRLQAGERSVTQRMTVVR